MSSPTTRLSPAEDRQLVARVRANDVGAFETVFHVYFPSCLRFAHSFVMDDDVAQDVVQDVFGWVWDHRIEWAPPSDILSYLLTAVRNRALDVLRMRQRRANVTQRYVAPGESPAMGGSDASADRQVELEERDAMVWRIVAELPEQRRTVLLLRWWHGLDWNAVAQIMGTSNGAAQVNHSRALKMLRERLPGALE